MKTLIDTRQARSARPGRSVLAALLAALTAALLLAPPALAHDIVLEPQREGVAVRYGHAKDWQPVQDGKLVDLQLLRGDEPAQDQRASLRPRRLDLLLPLSGGLSGGRPPLLVAARYDNGLWARLPASGGARPVARNTSRLMLPEATQVTNNLKFGKALLAPPDDTVAFRRRVGHLLELVPQRHPVGLPAGELLELLVLFKGEPAADVEVEVSNLEDLPPAGSTQRVRSDARGIVRVQLFPKGVNSVGALLERPNDGSLGEASRTVGADKFVLTATYTFVR